MDFPYKDKQVLIVGLGIQGGGSGAAKYFVSHGAHVTVTDKKSASELQPSLETLKDYPITYTLGQHDVADYLAADLIIKGPSVLWDAPEIAAALEKGIYVTGETAYFMKHSPTNQVIGVTGTRGKSTTTAMIYHILRTCGYPVYLAGNVPGTSTINLLDQAGPNDWVVLELSSWQLSAFHREKISPHIAVFTNFYEDHLNFYKDTKDYRHDKDAIWMYQQMGDTFIASPAVYGKIETEIRKYSNYLDHYTHLSDLVLRGRHNMHNASAAISAAVAAGISVDDAKKALQSFTPLKYRQEEVRKIGSIHFINDTTSTTPIALITALNTFSRDKVILLMGGNNKNLPIADMVSTIHNSPNLQKIYFLKGSMTDELARNYGLETLKSDGKVYDNFRTVIESAYHDAQGLEGEAYVLFSPAATSFAMFKNEFDRGEKFNSIVNSL